MGAPPGSHAYKGPFLPLSQHGGGQPKHSDSFCARWPGSSLARCQLPGCGMSPPVLPREREPSPEHCGFVQGSRAEWQVCVARAAGQGGKVSRLPHLFTWKRRWWPGPAVAATFMLELTGWGVPHCAHLRAACSMPVMWAGTWCCFSPSMCQHSSGTFCPPQLGSWSLGRDIEMGHRPSERWTILLVTVCLAA